MGGEIVKYCNKCGNQMKEGAKICAKCGKSVDDFNEISQNGESEEIAQLEDKSSILKNDTTRERRNSIESNEVSKNQYFKDKGSFVNKAESNKKALKIIAAMTVILIVLVVIFFSRIESFYYNIKCNNNSIPSEKIEYAAKAVKAYSSKTNKELLKNVLLDSSKDNLDLAEEKLKDISKMLTQSDIQFISLDIKEKKVDKLYDDRKYDDALSELGKIKELGGDFKNNKHYEDILYNIVSEKCSTPLRSSRNVLQKDDNIVLGSFMEDDFDIIVDVINANNKVKINLYKFKDGEYKQVDTINESKLSNAKIIGVYNYEDNKKGIYIKCNSKDDGDEAIIVIGIDDNKAEVKGKIYSNNSTSVQDIDGDGIYEILSDNINKSTSTRQESIKWYKVFHDCRTPIEVNGEVSSANSNSVDYIFPDSSSKYLSDDEVKVKSKEDLSYARNEIFARHGYVFKEEPYVTYFNNKSWYIKNPSYDGNDSCLNEYEKSNIEIIKKWENN